MRMATPVNEFRARGFGRAAVVLLALGGCLLWACWTTLAALAERWSSDPQYSHGFLVPVFALVVLWCRRDRFPAAKLSPSWVGLPVLLAGLGLWLGGARLYLGPVEAFGLLPILIGLCLLTGGRALLAWCWPALAFLAFMLPLPFQVEGFLAQPLRRMATVASTYLLQLFGFPALSEGNVILIEDVRLGVADACSGLGMLFTFFALATAVALITQRGLPDRVLIVASAVPIALVANVLRITATAAAYTTLGSEAAGGWVHDLSGWLMMPLALGLTWLVMLYLNRLFVPAEAPQPLALNLNGVTRPLPYRRKQGGSPLPCEPPVPAGRAAEPPTP
jgi:exosortase